MKSLVYILLIAQFCVAAELVDTTPLADPADGALTTTPLVPGVDTTPVAGTTTPVAGVETTPITTPMTTPITTPIAEVPTTKKTTATDPAELDTKTTGKTTTPTIEVPANPATMNASELSEYSLTVTMDAEQLLKYRATHGDEKATKTTATMAKPTDEDEEPAKAGHVGPNGDPHTQIDDTTKSLTFVTTRVTRTSKSTPTQASHAAVKSAAGSGAAMIDAANLGLVVVSIFIGVLTGALGL